MIKTTVAKLVTVKVAMILAATSAGGVALAATTGVLPNPLSEDPPASHSTPDTEHPGTQHPGQGAPSPSLDGLCTAFLAGAGAERGRALENPAFTALITAAGSQQDVESYCSTLVSTPTTRPARPPRVRATHRRRTRPARRKPCRPVQRIRSRHPPTPALDGSLPPYSSRARFLHLILRRVGSRPSSEHWSAAQPTQPNAPAKAH